MSEFWIETKPTSPTQPSEIYQLTSTTDMTIDLSGEATKHPVVDRSTITDNYVRNPPKITVVGLLSNIVNLSLKGITPKRTVAENVIALEALQASGVPFTVHFDKNLDPKGNCVFTALNFTKSSGMGTAYKVNMNIQQILRSSQVSFSVERFNQSKDVNNESGSKSEGGDNSVKQFSNSLLQGLIKSFQSGEITQQDVLGTTGGT